VFQMTLSTSIRANVRPAKRGSIAKYVCFIFNTVWTTFVLHHQSTILTVVADSSGHKRGGLPIKIYCVRSPVLPHNLCSGLLPFLQIQLPMKRCLRQNALYLLPKYYVGRCWVIRQTFFERTVPWLKRLNQSNLSKMRLLKSSQGQLFFYCR